jgi:hypothetical protein
MSSFKRTTHLLPAGIAGLGATLAIAVAMVGPAAAAVVSSAYTGSQLPATVAAVSPVDTGSQDYRGKQDMGLVAGLGATLEITEALQPGQTVSTATSGNVDFSIGDATAPTPALGPTSALQPGQTDSHVVARVASYDPAHEHLTSAPWPTSAPQPGQTGW